MKNLLEILGFKPKEGTSGVYFKKYSKIDNYVIEVNLLQEKVDYGQKIRFESRTTQNFLQEENKIVLECVDRLIEKGYKPEDIILEKTYPLGHNNSGRLDILVEKYGKAFLMIECKTWGKEFEKELKNINKNGGQLFTYFQNDTKADYLMLYTSQIQGSKIEYKNEIIKIENHYRTAGNVEDVFDRWNKITNDNGIFENGVSAYEFQSKFLKKKDLKNLTQDDSSFIFHQFLSILRKYSVSDKPNAFNKIFNLFLAKIYDEQSCNDDEELKFQWQENLDNPVSFQVRLIELHKGGMLAFLEKEIEGLDDVNLKGQQLEAYQKKFLKFNKIFDIKEVIDDESFDDNFVVLKEVVQLLEKYQIRYPRKQQHLSDFFERLLTTGLKQEAGQFFTPPPITKFIVKSLPIQNYLKNDIDKYPSELPAVIDYACGSGHFITEIMEEYQNIINTLKLDDLTKDTAKKELKKLQDNDNQYDWAGKYVYGIEKDYRLVKVAKVGCYFYGDGVAQIVHGDGLDNFENSLSYRNRKLLKDNARKPQFSFVVSNPPYSVNSFKGDIKNINVKEDFDLYKYLTDSSSEIEALFIERTKQLLKPGGIAAIILPSSILSNTGIYTKAREILLKYFEFVAITELGSNTFMATGTNTITLFLRKRENDIFENILSGINKIFTQVKDLTTNGIEEPIKKYLSQVWEGLIFEDYVSLMIKKPNVNISKHEIFVEYQKKLKYKNEIEFFEKVFQVEKEKIAYFILAYNQKLVLVKSGKKDVEKKFLGYEFSNRRGSEGIHPIQRGKTIEECTKLFSDTSYTDDTKASFYIQNAFENKFDLQVDENLKYHIFYQDLVEMLTFDRVDFEKTISLNIKKKVKIESRWEVKKLGEVCLLQNGFAFKSDEYVEQGFFIMRIKNVGDNGINLEDPKYIDLNREKEFSNFILKKGDILISLTGNIGRVGIIKPEHLPALLNQRVAKINTINEKTLKSGYLFSYLNNSSFTKLVISLGYGIAQHNVSLSAIGDLPIPLPPLEIQEKIVKEIEEVEKKESEMKEKVEKLKSSIHDLMSKLDNYSKEKLENIALIIKRGKSPIYGNSTTQIIKSGQARGVKQFDFSTKYYVDEKFILDERKLEKGDILINSTGIGTAGRVTLFNLDGNFVVDSHITILRLDNEKALSDFVLQSLVKIGFKTLEAMANGQSGQIELNISTIQNITIPLPPLQIQQQIVSEIEKIEKEIDVLEQELSKIPEIKNEILKKYL